MGIDRHDDRAPAEMAGHKCRLAALVEAAAVHLHREGRSRLTTDPHRERGDETRIDAAAQITDDRHVSAQAFVDSLEEHALERRDHPVSGAILFVAGAGEVHLPVASFQRRRPRRAVQRDGHEGPRLQRVHACEARRRPRNRKKMEYLIDAAEIRGGADEA